MSKKVILKSSDGETFEIDEAVAVQAETISHMVEDGCAKNEIPLGNVKGSILAMVIEYCKKHVEAANSATEEAKEELTKWDSEFMKKMDQPTVFEVVMAASYLNIKDLLDLSCQTIADMMKDNTPEENRTFFNIENDYTEEEEKAVRQENKWAFDE